jgi:hypothetical protein
MRFPSRTQDLMHLRGAGLILITGLAGFAAAACGGDDITSNNTLTIGFTGSGRGSVTGSPGSINCTNASGSSSGTCEADVGDGTEVTFSATAEAGSTFTGWGGAAATCGASTPCAVTISESQNIIANFEAAAATQTLTIAGGGSGTGSGRVVSDPAGIDCTITTGTAEPTGCSASFPTGTSVQLQVPAGTLVGWGGACSGVTCSVVMSGPQSIIATFTPDPQATHLGFVGQPSAVQVGTTMAPVQVAVQDAAGQTVAGRTDAITLRIETNPGNATLGGQITRNAEAGVATFTDLTVDQVGDGYTLAASASGLPEVTSDPFNVTTGAVARLAFSVQPAASTAAGSPLNPAVQVRVQDAQGGLLPDRTDQITISLRTNPAGGSLSGTRTATAVAGVATFSDLRIEKAGAGYSLAARAQNASGATSDPFAIVAGPARQLVINSAQSQSAPVSTAVPVRPSVKVMDAFNNPVEGAPVTWEVTEGDGIVVASTENPTTRLTGPLGLSTAVSWTLGPEVGTNNNELQASAAGLTGSPVIFKASGTVPAGQSVFTGIVSEITNVGFPPNPKAIANATLKFFTLPAQTPAGQATSKSDGSFVSPPLPGGNEYKIDVSADNYKSIIYQKPGLTAGVVSSLDRLGMVLGSDEDDGQAELSFTVTIANPAATSKALRSHSSSTADPVHVIVELYSGYYVGVSEPRLRLNTFEGDTDPETNSLNVLFDDQENPVGDWGVITVRVTAEKYQTVNQTVVLDDPFAQVKLDDIRLEPEP